MGFQKFDMEKKSKKLQSSLVEEYEDESSNIFGKTFQKEYHGQTKKKGNNFRDTMLKKRQQ